MNYRPEDFRTFLDLDDFAQSFTIGDSVGLVGLFETDTEIFEANDTAIRGYAPTIDMFAGDVSFDPLDELVTDITNRSDATLWPYSYRVIDVANDGTGLLTLILRLDP